MLKFKNKLVALGVAVVATVSAVPAFATVDTTAITSSGTDASTVGVAVLGVMIAIAAFKWIRKAL